MSCRASGTDSFKKMVIEQTRTMLHKHYCENDVEYLIAQMDEDIHWVGAGEQEYAVGLGTVSDIFRSFAGMVPRCNISDEEYHVLFLAPDVYMCTGRLWITTDISTKSYLRVHQRVTMIFRWKKDKLRCCHIHISNPYTEMMDDDRGFPVRMARQSHLYLEEQIEEQKKQIEEQTAMLRKMSYEDSLTRLYNRNKFNQLMNAAPDMKWPCLGVAYFDLNGLKATNDQHGHSAGDVLLQSAADQIRKLFSERAYRTGGDEFVVVDSTMSELDFYSAVAMVQRYMNEAGISYSIGLSWRGEQCSLKEQLEEADQRMYEEKRHFYRKQKRAR